MAKRNSSIELMRLVAMLMIVGAHFCTFALDVTKLPFTSYRMLLQATIYPMGKIGVVMFFAISAWFITEKGGIRTALRRVWLLEREVLFWSVALAASSLIIAPQSIGGKTVLASFFPLISGLWWYPTAYAIFLVLGPFAAEGLKLLGRGKHAALAITMFIVWTLLHGFWPIDGMSLGGSNYAMFLYLYVLITYYRWYMQPMSRRVAWTLTAIGFGIIALWQVLFSAFSWKTGKLSWMADFLSFSESKIAVLAAGFGLFALFSSREFSNRFINTLASAAFGVYLITEYPVVRTLLWGKVSGIRTYVASPLFVIYSLAIVFAVFVVALVISLLRYALFFVTIDRHRGAWFDALWNRCSQSRIIGKVQKWLLPEPSVPSQAD